MTLTHTSPLRTMRNHLRVSSVLRSEWIKMRSVRSTTWSLVALAVVTPGVAAISASQTMGSWHTMSASDRLNFDPTSLSLTGLVFSELIIGVLGVLVMSAEYGTGTIRSTLAAIPHRPLVLASKATVLGLVTLVVSELASFAAFFLGQALLRSPVPHATLSQPGVLRAVSGGGLAVALLGLFGLGLATIIRYTAGAISTFVATVLVLPIINHALPASISHPVGKFLPLNISGTLTSVKHVAGSPPALSPWVGLAVLSGYAIAALLAGGVLMKWRDT